MGQDAGFTDVPVASFISDMPAPFMSAILAAIVGLVFGLFASLAFLASAVICVAIARRRAQRWKRAVWRNFNAHCAVLDGTSWMGDVSVRTRAGDPEGDGVVESHPKRRTKRDV